MLYIKKMGVHGVFYTAIPIGRENASNPPSEGFKPSVMPLRGSESNNKS